MPEPTPTPPMETRIGMRWIGRHQWFPRTTVRVDERGTLLVQSPEGQISGWSLRLGGWEWKPAGEVKFEKPCPRCWSRGDVPKPEVKTGSRVVCPRCKGKMLLNDPNPFNENRRKSRAKNA